MTVSSQLCGDDLAIMSSHVNPIHECCRINPLRICCTYMCKCWNSASSMVYNVNSHAGDTWHSLKFNQLTPCKLGMFLQLYLCCHIFGQGASASCSIELSIGFRLYFILNYLSPSCSRGLSYIFCIETTHYFMHQHNYQQSIKLHISYINSTLLYSLT